MNSHRSILSIRGTDLSAAMDGVHLLIPLWPRSDDSPKVRVVFAVVRA